MSDTKSEYSNASSDFISEAHAQASDLTRLFAESKQRETMHNSSWKKRAVDINDIVRHYAPDSTGFRAGVKFIYRGEQYTVVADMASGYLRIYDNVLRSYIDGNGKPSRDRSKTHFKIKRREEMQAWISNCSRR